MNLLRLWPGLDGTKCGRIYSSFRVDFAPFALFADGVSVPRNLLFDETASERSILHWIILKERGVLPLRVLTTPKKRVSFLLDQILVILIVHERSTQSFTSTGRAGQ